MMLSALEPAPGRLRATGLDPPMSFTTATFFAFVMLVFGLYWSVRSRKLQNVILLVASYVFYGWWDPRLCGLIVVSSAVDFLVARALQTAPRDRLGRRRALLLLSCVANLGMLGTFKYYDFFVQALVTAAASVGVELHWGTLQLVLPVGISFYTFQTLGYTIDVYRRRIPASRDFVDYFAYVAFFPQLVAGPIERGARLLPQFTQARRFHAPMARDGLRQMLWGLTQKVALADNLGTFVDAAYGHATTGPVLALSTVAFALQIYWDFAGYSNLAIGTAKLLGFRLSRNFAYPYFSRSVAEFWRRWHITLSTWFRDYVYWPLGGNRRGRGRQVLAVLLTFTLSGLWHGAAWNFLVWGALSGLLALPSILSDRDRHGPDHVAGGERGLPRLVDLGRMVSTFALVCVAWVFFRAPTLAHALSILQTIATQLLDSTAYWELRGYEEHTRAFLPLAAIVMLVEWSTRRHEHPLVLPRWPRAARWALYTGLTWTTLYLMPASATPFIYFQF